MENSLFGTYDETNQKSNYLRHSKDNQYNHNVRLGGMLNLTYVTATFSNVTFVGPMAYSEFQNTNEYINGGTFNPNNGSSLGKFQAAMQIRRSSRLACFNSVAIGYPIGLIVDGEKGNTVTKAKEGNLKLQNIWFAGMGITGSDANKRYIDDLYDAANKSVIDANTESYSSTFFKTQIGNVIKDNISDLLLQDNLNVGISYKPTASSPLLSAAAFTDAALSSGFDKVNYIGAFDATSNWMEGWTNFDPNNTDY